MNKTTMTRAALREAIALKHGWESQDNETWWVSPENLPAANLPDYLNSMDDALPLLRELPLVTVYLHEIVVADANEKEVIVRYGKDGDQVTCAEVGKEAEAVSCAWWQFMTGELVELVEESQA